MEKELAKKKLKGSMVAVIRCKDLDTAEAICTTAVRSGIDALEITFSVPDAPALISRMKKLLPQTLVGAGTVLSVDEAEKALDSGADFIVSPCVVEPVGAFCKKHGVLCILGAATATEALRAYQAGSDVVKLFPGSVLPVGIIKALKAPMPFLDFMPTGGISDKNIRAWFDGGAYAVGLGGYLTRGIDRSNLEELTRRCTALKDACKGRPGA